MITLALKPHIERDGCHADRFDAYLDDVPILTSRQPLLDGARKLLELGHSADELLTARHHNRAYDSFKPKTIGELVKWTVENSDKRGLSLRKYRAFEGVASPAADNALAGINTHLEQETL